MGDWFGFGSAVNGLVNWFGSDLDRKANKEIADQNLAFQRENLDYMKRMQEQQWRREDTAMSRKVSDYVRAGLNPFAALQGSSGFSSSSPVSTTAPQYNYRETIGHDIANSLGVALDTYKALQQAKQAALETEYMKYNLWNDFSFNTPTSSFRWLPDGSAETTISDNWRLPENPNQVRKSLMGSLRLQESLKATAQREGMNITNDILKIDRQFAQFNQIADLILSGVQAYRGLRTPYVLRPKFDRR